MRGEDLSLNFRCLCGARFFELSRRSRQSAGFEHRSRGIARGEQTFADRTNRFVEAIIAFLIGGNAHAGAQCKRPIGYANDVRKRDFFCGFPQLITALPSARGTHDAALFQLQQDLFEKFARHIGFFGDVGDHDRLMIVLFGENEQRTQRVTGLLGKHAANPVKSIGYIGLGTAFVK